MFINVSYYSIIKYKHVYLINMIIINLINNNIHIKNIINLQSFN